MNKQQETEREKEIGTIKDYSEDMYKVYFEVGEYEESALTVLMAVVGERHSDKVVSLEHGYEVELPIQCIPEVVRLLSEENIAIYQIVRRERTDSKW